MPLTCLWAFDAKAKATNLQGQGRGSLKPRPMPQVLQVKANAKTVGLGGQDESQGHGSSKPRQRPLTFNQLDQGRGFLRLRPRPWVLEVKPLATRPMPRPLVFEAKIKAKAMGL